MLNITKSFRPVALLSAVAILAFAGEAQAQQFNPFAALQPFAPQQQPAYAVESDDAVAEAPRPELKRQVVNYRTNEAPGTIVIDTPNTFLYFVLGNGKAVRYGIGVGREGFTWSGVKTIARKAEWPDWHPPQAMLARQPYLPRFTAGGPGNPLGARAMYLGNSEYRIHGTNNPATIGHQVSSGCIRLTNEDVTDLYSRVQVGAKVVVLPQRERPAVEATNAYAPAPQSLAARTWSTIR